MENLTDCMYNDRYQAPNALIIDTCIECGGFIHEGQEYYDIKGMVICEECMSNYHKTGEVE